MWSSCNHYCFTARKYNVLVSRCFSEVLKFYQHMHGFSQGSPVSSNGQKHCWVSSKSPLNVSVVVSGCFPVMNCPGHTVSRIAIIDVFQTQATY